MARKTDRDDGYHIVSFPGKGQGLQTKLLLQVGTQIFDEFPIAYVVSNKQREVKCSHCLGPPSVSNEFSSEYQSTHSELYRCSKCKFVYYCGVRCQKKDWSIHKQECKNISKVGPKRPPDICRLASRLLSVLVKRNKLQSNGPCGAEPFMLTIETLNMKIMKVMESFQEFVTNTRKEMLTTFAVVLQSFVDATTIDRCYNPSFSKLLGLLFWLTCNCFNILDDDQNSVGIGIYENACIINHSCVPNCVAVFDGPRMSIRVIQCLKNNEEITISYIESIMKREDRQSALQEQYLFKCTCEKCIADSNSSDLLVAKCGNAECTGSILVNEQIAKCTRCGYYGCSDNLYSTLKCSYEKLESQLLIVAKSMDSNKLNSMYRTMIEASSLIPSDSIETIKCYETLFDGFVQSQDWIMALKCGLSLWEGYKSHFPNNHPITGIHLFKLGKLELVLENLRSGLGFLEQCRDILLLTHGKEHRMVNYLLELISNLKEEIKHSECK